MPTLVAARRGTRSCRHADFAQSSTYAGSFPRSIEPRFHPLPAPRARTATNSSGAYARLSVEPLPSRLQAIDRRCAARSICDSAAVRRASSCLVSSLHRALGPLHDCVEVRGELRYCISIGQARIQQYAVVPRRPCVGAPPTATTLAGSLCTTVAGSPRAHTLAGAWKLNRNRHATTRSKVTGADAGARSLSSASATGTGRAAHLTCAFGGTRTSQPRIKPLGENDPAPCARPTAPRPGSAAAIAHGSGPAPIIRPRRFPLTVSAGAPGSSRIDTPIAALAAHFSTPRSTVSFGPERLGNQPSGGKAGIRTQCPARWVRT